MKGFTKDGKFRPTEKGSLRTVSKEQIHKVHPFVPVSVGNKELIRHKNSVNDEKAEEKRKERTDYQYDQFLQQVTDYGSGDISHAIDKADEVGIGGKELSDLVREFSDETEVELQDVDINAVLYEHIMGIADGLIETATGFRPVDEGFYVAGNYLATTYDYTTEAQEGLQEAINKLDKSEKNRLKENRFSRSFLEDVDIEI